MELENNKKIKEFLDNILSCIRNKDIHSEVKMEIESHIFEVIDEFIDNGLNEEDAVDKAIKRMGQSNEIGRRLNKIHKPKPDYITIFLSIALIIIGLSTIYSLQKNNIVGENTLIKNLGGVILGSALGIGIYFFDYRNIKKHSYKIYFITLGALLLISNFDFRVNGVNMLLNSVSLLSTLIFLISLSGIAQSLDFTKFKNKATIAVLIIVPAFIQMRIPSIMTTLFYIISLNAVFLIGKASKKQKITLITIECIGSFLFLLKMLSIPHLKDRFLAFMPALFGKHPGSYMQTQSMKLLDKATLFGQNISQSNIEVPTLQNDLIFTYIVYSFGWVIAIVSLIIIIGFIVRNVILVFKIKDNFGKAIAISVITLLSLQFICTILYALGLSPITFGIPFISAGGMNIFTNCIMIGILSSVYRRRNYILIS